MTKGFLHKLTVTEDAGVQPIKIPPVSPGWPTLRSAMTMEWFSPPLILRQAQDEEKEAPAF
jgi:hypothetical protein